MIYVAHFDGARQRSARLAATGVRAAHRAALELVREGEQLRGVTDGELEAGDRVRFKRGPVGLVDPANPTRFVEETVDAGEHGTIAERQSNTVDWLYVRPDGRDDDLLVPEHRNALELVELAEVQS